MPLTDDQKRVVAFADSYNMVCALPGSGKTFTSISLCEKILNLSSSNSVAMVTFTRDAANEMKARVIDKLGILPEETVSCNTFHSFVLKQYKNYYPGFRLIIKGQYENLKMRAVRNSTFKGDYQDAQGVIDFFGQQLKPSPPKKDPDNAWDLYQTFVELVRASNGLDMAMVFRNVVLGMREGKIPPLPFTNFIVDEFQDTDNIQYAWLREHTLRGAKMTVVADDDQSIYAFRSARGYEVLKQFQEEHDAIGHVLSICFRCKPRILGAAKQIIEYNNPDRVPKQMTSFADTGGEVYIEGREDKYCEMDRIVELIKEYEGEEVAILSRNNRRLDEIQPVLDSHQIEYNRNDSKSFWDIPQVDSFMKILFSLINPNNTRYLNEVLGFLEEDEENIVSICREAKANGGFCYIEPQKVGVWRPSTLNFHQRWSALGSDTEDIDMINRRIKTIIQWIGDALNVKDGKGLGPIKSVGEIIIRMDEGSFHERVEQIVYRLTSTPKEKEAGKALVTLSTLHGSKGLEWKNVIILTCNANTIPSDKAVSIEEERRLFYVGMTRAEDRLYMIYFNKPSEFLIESFPEAIVENEDCQEYE